MQIRQESKKVMDKKASDGDPSPETGDEKAERVKPNKTTWTRKTLQIERKKSTHNCMTSKNKKTIKLTTFATKTTKCTKSETLHANQ